MKTFEAGLVSRDGTALYVRGWEPEERKPRAVIGLVHGLGEHSGRFAHVGRAMTEAGYVLASFDLRGHGKSGGLRGHTPSLDAYMQDIRAFFQWLTARYPDLPQFLYGHSLGGLLALTYAIQHGAGRKLTERILAAAPQARSREPREAMGRDIQAFIAMYRPHAAREETDLFPTLRQLVKREQYEEVADEMEKRERERFGADGFEKVAKKVAEVEKVIGIYDLDVFTPKS